MITAWEFRDALQRVFTWMGLVLMLAILIAIVTTSPPAPAHLLPANQ